MDWYSNLHNKSLADKNVFPFFLTVLKTIVRFSNYWVIIMWRQHKNFIISNPRVNNLMEKLSNKLSFGLQTAEVSNIRPFCCSLVQKARSLKPACLLRHAFRALERIFLVLFFQLLLFSSISWLPPFLKRLF